MQLDHGLCHGITGGIRIEATVDLWILVNKRLKPTRRWSGSGGGDAIVMGIDHKATDRVDGGLTKDNSIDAHVTDREVAPVLT